MPRIIEILRLEYDAKLIHQKIAQVVDLSKGAVSKYVSIAAAVGISSWPLPDGIDEGALERRLVTRTGKLQSHRYTQFSQRYRAWKAKQ